MTNFDFLKKEEKFSSFADVAVVAETLFSIDISSCIFNIRKATELAVKWMYSADSFLVMPYPDSLANLISTTEFRDIVGNDIWRRVDLIRVVGNAAAHDNKTIPTERAQICLENLYVFMDFVACCYANDYTQGKFNADLLKQTATTPIATTPTVDVDIDALIEENKSLRAELTARRKKQKQSYVPNPLNLTEEKTRKIYIDAMLSDAGWIEGENWINEYPLDGMPNKSNSGAADYVLFGDNGKPLAVVEAKRTCKDVAVGRQQAELYANLLEQKFGRRPVIFLTNGFETRITDNIYPERKVATIYSKRDLEKMFNLQSMRTSLANISVSEKIAGRYYQKAAIKAVCDSFSYNRRKALLVMATGSGKTRTIIGLVDVLLQNNWVKNILFLADRTSLVTQAKRSFANLLPDLSITNLCEDKDNYNAHCVFSTYQTMMHCIDNVRDEQGKLFTSGHFDLIICDEAHRSIYNKYRDIFNYFDAPLVGLTATPKDDIDKNTYDVFELENGVPTYGYELAQAVKDGYLVDFISIETKLKFLEEGIVYDDLSDEDKEAYEETFVKDGEPLDSIRASALNSWVFNEDTIAKVLKTLMNNGIKVDYGQKIGKTIIFAKSHKHAEEIFRIFNKLYPHLAGFAKVIDNQINYAQKAIDEFSDANKLPQIAISVDMLDTGIDVPEVVNLVFFKKVLSKAKFWQMIGRGTRICEGLLDGKNKDKFYIFDFCGNFEFFRISKGKASNNQTALQSAIFNLKAQIAFKLQDLEYQTDDLVAFRKSLVEDMVQKVTELDKENFAVKQHLKYVELYSDVNNYNCLSDEKLLSIKQEIAPLIIPDKDNSKAIRFDALVYGIELAYLAEKKHTRALNDLRKKIEAISNISNISEITAQAGLLSTLLHTDYIDNAGINEFENIRKRLRGLVKYVSDEGSSYYTNFDDDILSVNWNNANCENDDLKNYKAKAEFYVREHQDNETIAKLKSNIPLNSDDIKTLEKILWSEVGSKQDYETELGQKPLGEFVREIVGLDMKAAKEAFSKYLDEVSFDARQIYFVNQIIEYIVHNGIMKDLSVLQEPPFTDNGSVCEVFTDLSVWAEIRKIIEQVNANAIVA